MFCESCGTENDNGAKFCKKCGAPLKAAAENGQAQKNGGALASPQKGQPTVKMPVITKKSGIIIGAVAAVLAVIVIICIMVNAAPTIDLNKYLVVETSGYDGFGTANAYIDWDAIQEKYGDKLSFSSQAKKQYGKLLSLGTPMDALDGSVFIALGENSGLSNGTEIAYTWNVDEESLASLKCKVKYKDGVYTVSGLTEVETFDAFEGLTLEFSGIAPNGNANLNYVGSAMNSYDFRCDQTSGLSNGDTITVSIDGNNMEWYVEQNGRVPEVLEKQYTVEGLSSYLSHIADLKEESLENMKQQATDVFYAYVAQEWDDEGVDLQSFTYIGDYLLTSKNETFYGGYNTLYLVYKAQVRNTYFSEEGSYDQVNDLYWWISFSDLLVETDGSITVDVTRYSTPYESFVVDSEIPYGWFGTMSWRYKGYATLADLYKVAVTSYMDAYNHEDNVDESLSAEPAVMGEGGEQTDEGENVENADDGYILPDSDKRLLTKDDLRGLSAEECKIARNEIYARHGRKFKDEELQKYFDACDWYEGTKESDDFEESELNDTEIQNKNLIVEYEEEKRFR